MVVSCGGSGETRWRTELQLGRGESLDDCHGIATSGTEPERDDGRRFLQRSQLIARFLRGNEVGIGTLPDVE